MRCVGRRGLGGGAQYKKAADSKPVAAARIAAGDSVHESVSSSAQLAGERRNTPLDGELSANHGMSAACDVLRPYFGEMAGAW
jgi:hypothetical protein